MADDPSALHIHIRFDYLNAQQLGRLLLGLDGIYEDVLYAEAPHLKGLPSSGQARLRVGTVRTGNSITVEVVQGITQVAASADPTLVGIASGAGTLLTLGLLLTRFLRSAIGVLDAREDLRDKKVRNQLEHERQRIEIDGLHLTLRGLADIERSERIRRQLEDVNLVLSEQVPQLTPARREELATDVQQRLQAVERVFGSANIQRVSIALPRDLPQQR
jgi:hypothetical protein